MPIDVQFDETRGNLPAPECLASLAKAEDLYKATVKIFTYADPADGDDAFATTPSSPGGAHP